MTAHFKFNQILSKDIQQLFDNNIYTLSDLYRNPDIFNKKANEEIFKQFN